MTSLVLALAVKLKERKRAMSHDEEYLRDREEFFTEPIEVVSLEEYKVSLLSEVLKTMTQGDWISLGLRRGFCGPPVCVTHDGVPMDLDEEHELEMGGDPCVHMIRPYESLEVLKSVEKNHSPSIWRKDGFL